jgi:hypothetical protein
MEQKITVKSQKKTQKNFEIKKNTYLCPLKKKAVMLFKIIKSNQIPFRKRKKETLRFTAPASFLQVGGGVNHYISAF